jgi:hypothetical protein
LAGEWFYSKNIKTLLLKNTYLPALDNMHPKPCSSEKSGSSILVHLKSGSSKLAGSMKIVFSKVR